MLTLDFAGKGPRFPRRPGSDGRQGFSEFSDAARSGASPQHSVLVVAPLGCLCRGLASCVRGVCRRRLIGRFRSAGTQTDAPDPAANEAPDLVVAHGSGTHGTRSGWCGAGVRSPAGQRWWGTQFCTTDRTSFPRATGIWPGSRNARAGRDKGGEESRLFPREYRVAPGMEGWPRPAHPPWWRGGDLEGWHDLHVWGRCVAVTPRSYK